jgi:hypothetical protein
MNTSPKNTAKQPGDALQLGVQRDGTALVAVWLAPVAAERWYAELGDLPETARGGLKRQHHVYRVPASTIPDGINLACAEGMHIEHYDELEHVDGSEIAELPASWLSWLITWHIRLAADAVEYPRISPPDRSSS